MTEYCLNLTERQVRERIKRLALILTLLRKGTVPIKRNLTGNAGQNAFCCRSTCVPVPVMYLFGIRSVPVLYPFHIRSLSVLFCSVFVLFLFCQHVIGNHSVSILYPFVFPVRFLTEGGRAQTQTARSGDERTNHGTTTPPLSVLYRKNTHLSTSLQLSIVFTIL